MNNDGAVIGRWTRMRNSVGAGSHWRRMGVLLSGSVLSQAIPMLAAPLLTRLYSTSEYGLLALFGSCSAVVAALASGRYHMGITLPRADREAKALVDLSFLVALVVTGLSFIGAVIWTYALPMPATLAALGPWVMAVPVAAFLMSGFDTLTVWNLRLDRVGRIARASVTKAGTGAVVQIALGAMGAGVSGILGGNLISLLAGNGRLVREYVRQRGDGVPRASLRRLARDYSRFPKYDVWSNLANVLGVNLLIFGMAVVFSAHVVGQFALAFRILTLPAALLGATVGQVYLREASLRLHDNAAALRAFDKTMWRLIAASVAPFPFLLVFGPWVFTFVFGPGWGTAGSMAAAMIPMVWLRFIASPLSTTFLIYSKQHALLWWQLAILMSTVVTFAGAHVWNWDPLALLTRYSILMGVVYAMVTVHARLVVKAGGIPVQKEA